MPELASMPAMMVEGMQDHAIDPERAIGGFQALYPDAPVTILPNAGHFCHGGCAGDHCAVDQSVPSADLKFQHPRPKRTLIAALAAAISMPPAYRIDPEAHIASLRYQVA